MEPYENELLSDDDIYLRVSTVAKMFEVNIRTARNWIREGKIKPVYLPTGDVRVTLAEVKRFVGVKYDG